MSMASAVTIRDIVQTQLQRPRSVGAQMAGAFTDLLQVDDPLDGLDPERLGALQPFEWELLCSPLFTPSSQDLEECEFALPATGIPVAAVSSLVEVLTAANLLCSLSYGHRERLMPLVDVVIERYVRLLHLSAGIAPLLLPVLDALVAGERSGSMNAAEKTAIFSQARRSIWNTGNRAQLLASCLQAMAAKATLQVVKVRFLTDFVGSYRPTNKQELVGALLNLVEAYRQDSEHPVYNQQLEHYQGDNIRSQYCGPAVKQFRLAMARALLVDFADW